VAVEANSVVLSGTVVKIDVLRHTPAGVPVLDFSLAHGSAQVEAGHARQVEFEVPAMAVGELARRLAGRHPGDRISIAGFLASRSRRSTQLVVHATQVRD
jgi:primosomal replication protein N